MEHRSNQAFFAVLVQIEKQFRMKIKDRVVTALFFETSLTLIRQTLPINESRNDKIDNNLYKELFCLCTFILKPMSNQIYEQIKCKN